MSSPAVDPAQGKHPGLIVHEQRPYNAESPVGLLDGGGDLTPLDAFYVRSHGDVPDIDPDAWRLTVDGLVERPLELDLASLMDGTLPVRRITATLQCAGNQRIGLLEVADIPGEAPWGPGATSTATWTGVALKDVLRRAGALPDAEHVAFTGADEASDAKPRQRFGASIALREAQSGDVLLAWAMNDLPLSPVHGAPVRAVVPGHIGARSVKWLQHVELREEPTDNYFQATVYRLLVPDEQPAAGRGVALGEVALNSAILSPADNAELTAGPMEVRGYAFAGGQRRVVRVDVSANGGTTWQQAELLDDLGPHAWRRWQTIVDLPRGEHELVVRAWDSAAAVQPEHPASVWNTKGYVNNAWARTTVTST